MEENTILQSHKETWNLRGEPTSRVPGDKDGQRAKLENSFGKLSSNSIGIFGYLVVNLKVSSWELYVFCIRIMTRPGIYGQI